MASINTISFFKFNSFASKYWALKQMGLLKNKIKETNGLEFYKLMGSGKGLGFNPLPDWSVYSLLCGWESQEKAEAFFKTSSVFNDFTTHTAQHWSVFLKTLQSKGSWGGKNLFTPNPLVNLSNPLIAVITRASIKPKNLLQFWKFVPTSQMPIKKGASGLIFTKGIGEIPLLQMATFSLWENLDSLKQFAYSSAEHKKAIEKTQQLNWYSEEMFIRFQPYFSVGIWGGKNPLENYLEKNCLQTNF